MLVTFMDLRTAQGAVSFTSIEDSLSFYFFFRIERDEHVEAGQYRGDRTRNRRS